MRVPHVSQLKAHPVARGSLAILLPIVLAIAIPSSCSGPLLPAVGSSNEIGLVTMLDLEDGRIELLRGVFSCEIKTVQGEPAFDLKLVTHKARRNWKAHIVLVDLAEADQHRLVGSLLSKEERDEWGKQKAHHGYFRDVWAMGQAVLLIHANDPASLREHLHVEGSEIYEEFDSLSLEALRDGLYAGGEEVELESRLRDEHGFGLRIPIGFLLEGGDSIAEIKRIVPEEPKRWLLIHYGHASMVPSRKQEWIDLRDSVLCQVRQGDRIDRTRGVARDAMFQGDSCVVVEGVWQNEQYVMGGPFRSICVVREDRYYLIDMSVYHPPAPKLPALRQLRAIAQTFETYDASRD